MSPTLHVTTDNQICHDELMLKKHNQTLCCGACIDCEDNQSPNAYRVVIDGIRNKGGEAVCDACGDLNGTYVIPLDPLIPSKCVWYAPDILSNECTPTATYRSIKVIATSFIGQYTISVTMDLSPPGIPEYLYFLKLYGPEPGGPKPDCDNLMGEKIDDYLTNQMSDCDGSLATCEITSL